MAPLAGGPWRALALLACGLALYCAVALAVAVAGPATPAEADDCFASVHDRPVLEDPDEVISARRTGWCAFRFDGVYYIVENLPEEYVDYSAWCVRLP